MIQLIVIISQLRCFLTFAGQRFNILIVLRASGLKATSSEAFLWEDNFCGKTIFVGRQVLWEDNFCGKTIQRFPVGRQFFALLLLSSRRSGGSSLGFRAGSL